jgi:polyhydroxyalkanoate synthesis regulator phasin
MTLTPEVDAATEERLARAATASGVSPAQYVESMLEERLGANDLQVRLVDGGNLAADERRKRLDELIARIGRSKGSLGRNGLPWRELLHEGHKY